jgi:hypothetical protein
LLWENPSSAGVGEWQFGESVVHPPDTGIVIWLDFNVQSLEVGQAPLNARAVRIAKPE